MVKEKPNGSRLYDQVIIFKITSLLLNNNFSLSLILQDGYRRRAACICVRSDSEAEVLLVTSSRRPELWIVPGGGVSIRYQLVESWSIKTKLLKI